MRRWLSAVRHLLCLLWEPQGSRRRCGHVNHPPAHAQGGGPATGQGDPTRPPGPQGDSGFPLWLSPQTQSRRPQATGPMLPGPAQQRFSLGGQRKWRETSWAQSKGTDNISSAGSECRVRVETEAGPQGLEVGSELLGEPDLGFPRRFPLSGYLNHFEKVIRSLLSHPSFLCGQQQPRASGRLGRCRGMAWCFNQPVAVHPSSLRSTSRSSLRGFALLNECFNLF